MFHFPDSDTGYYDTERAYREEDARVEAQQLSAEHDRFEYEAEEAQSTLWAGESDLDQATRRCADNSANTGNAPHCASLDVAVLSRVARDPRGRDVQCHCNGGSARRRVRTKMTKVQRYILQCVKHNVSNTWCVKPRGSVQARH